MNLRKLSNEDIENIYNNHMIKDFPKGELKPLHMFQNLNKEDFYVCYGLYENEELLAYAFLACSELYLLIDYYAVCEKHRDSGVGSEFLRLLKKEWKNYNGIIVEVESIEDASDEAEKIVRKRRIDFYRKNGMIMTNICSTLFGVDYYIMCLCNASAESSVIYEGIENIYKKIMPNKFEPEYVRLYYREI